MPGIFGIVPRSPMDGDALRAVLGTMGDAMAHRSSYVCRSGVRDGVGMGRIGPGFLNPESQPAVNASGTHRAVFDGELFDPDAIRSRLSNNASVASSDAELVLRTFEQRGSAGVADLAGAYVGFVYDATTERGYLFTDRLGLRGCYYTVCGDGTFLFASELKSIVASGLFNGRIDEQAAAEFLSAGYPLLDRTLFREIKYLPHGSVLTLSGGAVSVSQYWDCPREAPPSGWTFDDAVAEGASLLGQAVRRQLRHGPGIGVLLSGGLDSRAIVALAAQADYRPPTFCLGSLRNAEQRLAARVARRLGLEHHSLDIPSDFLCDYGRQGMWWTDAMFPVNHMHWLAHLDTIGGRSRSIMSGYLGGVFLGGVFLRPSHLSDNVSDEQREAMAGQLTDGGAFWDTGLTPGWHNRLTQALRASRRELASLIGDRGAANELDRLYLYTDERRFTNLGNLGMIGTVADVKYPFGDYDLLDLYGRTPPEWRLGGRLYKRILCKAMPEVLDIPCISANTRFVEARLDAEPNPWRLRWARAAGTLRFAIGRLTGGRVSLPDRRTYVHYAHWFRTVPRLRRWVSGILLDDRTLDRGYFDRSQVRDLLSIQLRKGYVFDVLSRMITFEMWHRFFVDKEPLEPVDSANE